MYEPGFLGLGELTGLFANRRRHLFHLFFLIRHQADQDLLRMKDMQQTYPPK